MLTQQFLGKHQLPLSSRRTMGTHQNGWESFSSSSPTSTWGSTSSSNSQRSSPNSSPPSSTDGSYTGHFGPPDNALREFYDKYVPHGSARDMPAESDWNSALEPSTHGYWGDPSEQIPVQSVTVQKRRKDKTKESDSRSDNRSKKSRSGESHKSKR